jgi:hypothetical protein
MKSKFAILIAATVSLSALGAASASASTVYTYTGNDFTSVTGSYTTTDMVTGRIDLATALGDNFGPGAISPVSFSFSDGVQTLTNTNSTISSNVFETNSAGTIVQWVFEINNTGDTGGIATLSALTIIAIVGDDAFNIAGTASIFNDAGTWTTSVAATPLPAALPLFTSGLGVIVVLGWQRKRKIGAPRAA